jgi:hypothetical protein
MPQVGLARALYLGVGFEVLSPRRACEAQVFRRGRLLNCFESGALVRIPLGPLEAMDRLAQITPAQVHAQEPALTY